MKRILSLFIITFIFSNAAHAAGAICEINVQSANECNIRAGCIWDGTTCTFCEAGTYNPGQLPESGAYNVKCASCPTSTQSNNTTVSTIGTTSASGGEGATSKNQCTYTVSCTTDQYFDGNDDDGYGCVTCPDDTIPDPDNDVLDFVCAISEQTYSDTDGDVEVLQCSDYVTEYKSTTRCLTCGANAKKSGDKCVCEPGYHDAESGTNSDTDVDVGKNCVQNTYQVIFKGNNNKTANYSSSTPHGSTVSLYCDLGKYGDTIQAALADADHYVVGWEAAENQINYDCNDNGNVKHTVTNDTTLVIKWEPFLKITYDPSTLADKDNPANTAQTATARKNETIILNCNHGFERTGYRQSGWETDGGEQKYTCGDEITVTGDMTLYATWSGKPYDVIYKKSDGGDSAIITTQSLIFGEKSNQDNYCSNKAVAPKDISYDNPGHKFVGWKCNYTKDSTQCPYTTDYGLQVGSCLDDFSQGNNITLTAGWKKCSAGYYCSGGKETACPAGSTSDEGADDITDCYLLGGTTKICGGNGCLTLPDDIRVFYNKSN